MLIYRLSKEIQIEQKREAFQLHSDSNCRHTFNFKAVDKWVLGGAEGPPNFWHLSVFPPNTANVGQSQ